MAVLKAKPEKIVDFFLGILPQSLITPLVITRVGKDLFDGAKDDTVTLRVKGLRARARNYEWRTRTAPIVYDDIEGGAGIAIKLDTHVYSATKLTDEHMTLDDVRFGEDVLQPQVDAVVDDFEAKVVAGLRGADAHYEINFPSSRDPHLVAVEAKRLMDSDKVAPAQNRSYLVGSNISASWLASDRLSRYDSVGLEGTPALRDAIIGKLSNAPVIEVPGLDPDEGYYIHKTALVLGNVAPVVPQGVTAGRTGISKNGFAVRWIQDYDPNFVSDRSVVSSFVGINDIKDQRHLVAGTYGAEADGTEFEGKDFLPGDLLLEADRKNVRLVKLNLTDGGSVLPDGDVVDTTDAS